MIRLSELKLPLSQAENPEPALRQAVCMILGLPPEGISGLHVFKRSFDARKADLMAVYIVDVTLADAAAQDAMLARFANNSHVNRTPDMLWQPPAAAPAGLPLRPVVVGFGPC